MKALTARSKELLERRRRELRHLVEGATAERNELDAQGEADWPDRASTVSSADVLTRVGDFERRELLDIEAALRRIEDGTWGRCETCGGPIGTQRLMALPEARQCLACRSRSEARP
jgi:RNA polymerase-binding protein DksA